MRLINPWQYNLDLAGEIIKRISLGDSLRTICETDGMPARETVHDWLDKYPDFATKYADARIKQADVMDEKILDVADRVLTGKLDPHAARVALGAYQWRAARLNPKRYGDAVIMKGDKDNPIEIGLAAMLDAAAARRARLSAPDVIEAELIEAKPLTPADLL